LDQDKEINGGAFQKDVYKTGIKESRNGRREKRKRLVIKRLSGGAEEEPIDFSFFRL